jgi:N-acetylmuramoyl-L-alanine amidase
LTDEGLPLKVGHHGPQVRDLHRRLGQAEFDVAEAGDEYTDATREAVEAFQRSRGLEPDGECGRHTWAALAEAAHRLGDRLLYLQAPMLRGDDVGELQHRLGALGFDAGRIDGIFGPDTARALGSFQRNAGLPTDAIFGPESLAALNRLGGRETQAPVATVRERERLRSKVSELGDRTVVLGEPGGLGTIADTIARRLRRRGLRVEIVMHPDGSHHARVANELDADLYIGLRADDAPQITFAYFASGAFSSPGGSHLATLLAASCIGVLGPSIACAGRRLPVLRETRMAAVDLRIGPTTLLSEQSLAIAEAITDAVVKWLQDPVATSDDATR